MDAARQALRFSIPAGILFLLLFAYQGTLEAGLYGRSPTTVALATQPIVAFLLVVAALPIGFLLYQLYYVEYSPFSRLTGYVRRDRGAEILRGLARGELSLVAKVLGVTPRLEVTTIEWVDLVPPRWRWFLPAGPRKRHPWAWLRRWLEPLDLAEGIPKIEWIEMWMLHLQLVKSLLDVAIMSGETELKREYTILSDIDHALGVARVAVWLAWVSLLPLNLLASSQRYEVSLNLIGLIVTNGCLGDCVVGSMADAPLRPAQNLAIIGCNRDTWVALVD